MSASFIEIHPQNPQERKLDEVVGCLNQGGLIIYPTDTIYAIGCSIKHPKAIQQIGKIKGIKPEKLHLSFICADMRMATDYVKSISTPTFKLMKKLLPGPYTFILQAGSQVPKILGTKKNTVGIRIPNHPIPIGLVERLGHPLITASVKADDEILEYTTDPEEIFHEYQHMVDMLIASGMGGNVASTVIDCTSDEPIITRKGLGDLDW